MSTFGYLTIGQSPRIDILASMLPGVNVDDTIQHGALDCLTPGELASLAPRTDEIPLVTRLRDSTEVLIGKERIVPLLQASADRAIADGADAIAILCTGEFTGLDIPVPVVYPDRILSGVVNALLPTGTLGVLMPHEDQSAMMSEKWYLPSRSFIGATVSPYSESDQLVGAARTLGSGGASLIVMDCMGYTDEMKATVAHASGLPVVLSNRLVGRVIEELLGGR